MADTTTLSDAAQARIDALRVKLAARTETDPQGVVKAKPGFGVNVEAIRTEIARLEAGGNL